MVLIEVPSMFDILEELGSYDVVVYLIYFINANLGPTGDRTVAQLFDFMRHLAVNDNKDSCLKWIYASEHDK